MNTKKTLNHALQGFITRLEKTEKFALAQAPEICKQMVQEALIDSWMKLLASVALIMPLAHVAYLCLNHFRMAVKADDQASWFFGIIISMLCITPFAINTYDSVNQILFVKYCPKLFLLRKFKELMK